jgi:hypothetical protein
MQESTRESTHEKQKSWQDQYFTFVKRVEAPVLETTTRVVARLAELLPERPAFLAPMPKAHDVREAVGTGFTFRKRMVEEQTMFARRMMKAMEPVVTKLDTVHTPEKTYQPKASPKMAPKESKVRAA